MNETLRIMDARHSTRAFSDQQLSTQEKEAIFHAAFRAPTAGNMMLYSIIEVEDQTIKERLVQTCDNQPFIAKSPFVLIFLADYQRWWDYYQVCGAEELALELNRPIRKPQAGDMLLACCDALIAAQNAAIAAESLGIHSCYIGDILENYEIHRELFCLPQYVLPVAMLCFGFPRNTNSQPDRVPRFDPQFIAFKNKYQQQDKEQLLQMFSSLEAKFQKMGVQPTGAKNVGQHNYLRKFVAEFSFEMNRSVQEMLLNWSKIE
ncbi:MAG: nitroreductase family protein [Anaerolineaceae bacterium]